jgi:hypothetical protein
MQSIVSPANRRTALRVFGQASLLLAAASSRAAEQEPSEHMPSARKLVRLRNSLRRRLAGADLKRFPSLSPLLNSGTTKLRTCYCRISTMRCSISLSIGRSLQHVSR